MKLIITLLLLLSAYLVNAQTVLDPPPTQEDQLVEECNGFVDSLTSFVPMKTTYVYKRRDALKEKVLKVTNDSIAAESFQKYYNDAARYVQCYYQHWDSGCDKSTMKALMRNSREQFRIVCTTKQK